VKSHGVNGKIYIQVGLTYRVISFTVSLDLDSVIYVQCCGSEQVV
jgi:hypothetical protein